MEKERDKVRESESREERSKGGKKKRKAVAVNADEETNGMKSRGESLGVYHSGYSRIRGATCLALTIESPHPDHTLPSTSAYCLRSIRFLVSCAPYPTSTHVNQLTDSAGACRPGGAAAFPPALSSAGPHAIAGQRLMRTS